MGLHPQDILVLLLMILEKDQPIYQKEMAARLHLSPAAVSYSIRRLKNLGMLSQDHNKIMVQSLLDFIFYALHLVFPAVIGGEALGILTVNQVQDEKKNEPNGKYVWRSDQGRDFGQQISPLYESVPLFVLNEPHMYQVLRYIDAIRIGNSREKNLAFKQLASLLKHS